MRRRKALSGALGITAGIFLASKEEAGAVGYALLAVCLVLLLMKDKSYLTAVTVFVVFAVAGACLFEINLTAYKADNVNNAVVTVEGVVTDSDDILRDCEINGEKTGGRIKLTAPYSVKGNKKLAAGSKIYFVCKLGDYAVDKDGIRATEYKQNLRYYTTEMLTEVTLAEETRPSLDERIRLYAKGMLTEYFDEDTYGIAYAMLFGDKTLMSDEASDAFSDTGIAHIFAVSGLHVGFVVMLVNRLVGRHKKTGLFVSMAAVMFYAYLCGFSPSVMRAMIMTGVLLTVRAFGREPDFLSSVCFAAGCILLLKPFYLFDIGFEMSVGAVLGICFVTKSLERLVAEKGKILGKTVSAVGISVGATMGTAPFMAQYFGDISVIGVFFNVIVIPIVSIIFMALLVCLMLPVLFFAMPLLSEGIKGITYAAKALSEVPALTLFPAGIGIMPYFVFLYALGGHTLYNAKNTAMLCAFCVLCVTMSVFSYLMPVARDEINYFDTGGTTFEVTTADGERYLFSTLADWYDYLEVRDKGEEITLYILDYQQMDETLAVRLAEEKTIRLKVLSALTNDEKYYLLRSKNVEISRVRNEDNGEVKIYTTEYLTKTLAVTVEMRGQKVVWLPELTEFQREYVLDNTDGDAYICSNGAAKIKQGKPYATVVDKNYEVTDGVYCAATIGNFTFRFFNDKIIFNK